MPQKTTHPRVIALYRVSTEEQAAEDRAGLSRQKEAVARTVANHALDVIRTIELVDVSGTNVLLNSEFQGMLQAVECGDVCGVVVADQDRFIRADELQSLVALDVLKRAKAKLYTAGQVFDFSTDDGILTSHLFAILAGHELRTLRKRSQGAKEEKRKSGRCPSASITLPRGVSYDRKANLFHYTDEVEPVKEAFRLIDESGETNMSAIGESVGIHHRTLHNLLRNPIYTGWRVYDKKRGDEKYQSKDGRQADRKKVVRESPIRVQVIAEPAVSLDRFERVQKVLADKSTQWRRQHVATEINLGTGIAVCGHCGRRLYASSGKRKKGSRQGYYYCACNDYRNRRNGYSCVQPNIPKKVIDATLVRFAADYIASPEFIRELAEKLHAPAEDSARPVLENNLASIDRRKRRLLDAYEDEAIELNEYKARRIELEGEAVTLRRILDSEFERKRIRENSDVSLKRLVHACLAFQQILTEAERRDALQALFSTVAFDGEKIVGCGFLIPGIRPAWRTENGSRTGRDSSRPRA